MISVFAAQEVLPGVFHIRDPLGVHMTLLMGCKRALLFDAGYGTDDLHKFVSGMTSLPLTLVLSHGHHDHALGAMHFPSSLMLQEDLPVFRTYTGRRERERVLAGAGISGIRAERYLGAVIPEPLPLEDGCFDLGGMSAQVVRAPGHTPGSIALWVPERGLILLGDSWNPQTWVFFPEALEVRAYARSFRLLMGLLFTAALAPHAEGLVAREGLLAFARGLDEEGISGAKPVVMPGYGHLKARAFEPSPGSLLVFKG